MQVQCWILLATIVPGTITIPVEELVAAWNYSPHSTVAVPYGCGCRYSQVGLVGVLSLSNIQIGIPF